MKVVHLIDTQAFAGTERHMLHLVTALRELNVDAGIACPAGGALGKIVREAGIFALDLNGSGTKVIGALFRLVRALRAGHFDLLHAHNGRTALLAAVACTVARRGSLVTTQHFLEPARMKRRGLKARAANRLHRWVDERTKRIIAISEAVREALLSRGYPVGKVTVVLNGISDPRNENLPLRHVMRARLDVPESTPLIVTSSRLEKEKAVDVLIRAMGQVVSRLPDARCLIAGEGTERPELERLIDEAGLTRSVSLLGFRSDVLAMVAAADVFALPSPAEPFGLALLESMALGIPTVATSVGGPPEILDSGKAGWLVAPNDPTQMAEAIHRILQEPGLASEFSHRGRQRFLEHFTARKMALQTQAVYVPMLGVS